MRTLREIASRLFSKPLQRRRFMDGVVGLDSLLPPPSRKPERRRVEKAGESVFGGKGGKGGKGKKSRSLSYVWLRGSQATMEALLAQPILVRSTDVLEYDHEGLVIRMGLFHFWEISWEAVDDALKRFFRPDLPDLKIFIFHAERALDVWFIEEALRRAEDFLKNAPSGNVLKSYHVRHQWVERGQKVGRGRIR